MGTVALRPLPAGPPVPSETQHRGEPPAPATDRGAQLERVLEQAPDAFVALGADGRVAGWNRAAEEMFGWSAAESFGRRLEELIIPDHLREAHNRGVDRALRTGETSLIGTPVELEALHRDGHLFPVELKIGLAAGDERVAFTAFLRDVSERHAADAALREAEERFRNSFDRAPIGMALLSLEGRWLKVNDALCEIVGHSGAELRARPIAGVAHPDDLDRTLVALGGLATGERAEIKMEERWVHAGGHTIWVQVNASVVTDDVGAPLHFVAQIQDVSERRRTSQYFEAQHAVSRTLAEAASLEHALDEVLPAIGAVMEWSVGALWMTCPDARVIRAERVWCRPGLEDFADATRSLELARGVGLPGRIWKTGEPRWLEDVSGDPHFARKQAATDNALRSAIGLPVVGADGVIGVIEFFSRDIRPPEPEMLSRLVAIGAQVGQYIERQRAEREADRLKNEFFALVSHELRTPLTSMVGYLELLLEEDEGELSSHHRHFLDVIDRNAGRLQRLVGDLLFAAELEAGNLSLEIGRADLGGVVREAVQTLRHRAESRSIELILETEDVPACGGDHDRIGQAVDNLLSNALKYTPEGGRVVVRLLRSGGRAVIEIEDSGIGIPDWEQDRLFERFFRASSATERAIPGVGLGLSIVQAIIDGHGGRVSLESREGVGSRFSIELPLAAPVSGGGTAGLRTVERSPAPDGRLRRPLAPTNASRDRSSSSTAAAPKW